MINLPVSHLAVSVFGCQLQPVTNNLVGEMKPRSAGVFMERHCHWTVRIQITVSLFRFRLEFHVSASGGGYMCTYPRTKEQQNEVHGHPYSVLFNGIAVDWISETSML